MLLSLAYSRDSNKNPAKFSDFIASLGLADKLGMQISGEVKPQVKRPGEKWWDGFSLTLMAYGYALRLTPMHTLALYNAVANDGKMMKPLLVKELRHYGETVESFEPQVINNKICSRSTLRDIKECLEGVVNQGTAATALKNPYYTVAAKTGTARIAIDNKGYVDEHNGINYLATLVGYFPADKPKYSCIVSMKTYYGRGNWNTYYGGSLAAPVFRALADQVYASNYKWQKDVVIEHADSLFTAPKIKSGLIGEMEVVSKNLGLQILKDSLVDKWAISKVDNTKKVNLVEPLNDDPTLVPYVVGMGLKDAVYLLENRGLKVKFTGRGKVVYQSLRQGQKFRKGSEIHLRLI